MMEQYFEIKKQYEGHLLFYRLGDFYEMFFEDAQVASRELDLTLTARDCGEGNRAPMCGVPYHSVETYIGKLIQKGYKIAICEQTEDPALAKGLVKREVIRVVTPGTLIETSLLNETKNNYLASVYISNEACGICFADISTAEIHATDIASGADEEFIVNEMSTYSPSEIICNVDLSTYRVIGAFMKEKLGIGCSEICPERFAVSDALKRAGVQFGQTGYEDEHSAALVAVGAALSYIKETQKTDISYLSKLDVYENRQYLEMDMSTRRNLELCETMLNKEKRGSLLWVLDKTNTAMGARLLRSTIEHPLTNAAKITRRQRAVGEIASNFVLREELRDELSHVLDLERLMTKITYGTAGARELRAVAQTLAVLPNIKKMLDPLESEELASIFNDIDVLDDIYSLIDAAIDETPPFQVKEGGIIKDGYSSDVDELRSIMSNASEYIRRIEAEEKEKTGIKNLRIGNNRVFGYYIEVTKSYEDLVPENYIRKQTLANCERYITKELKNTEATILGASDKVKALEYEIFSDIRNKVADAALRIRKSAAALSELDVFVSLAEAAIQNGYVCPEIDCTTDIIIKDGRHPVVEKFVTDSYFVPNDVELNTEDRRIMLITGPNMAGKSTYMRQTALIILMAQIGSFVPASYARIGIVDKLFTRVGASDDLASGTSTFMLEMKEVAAIVKGATKKSFIIYDEIGRGTSTYDGMSIARAVVEYTADRKLGARTMFATHYHELTSLEDEIEGVVNYNVAVKRRGDDLTFLRKIVRGPVDESYGIQVAKLAGIPSAIVKRAKEILEGLEGDAESGGKPAVKHTASSDGPGEFNISLLDLAKNDVCDSIKKLDINTLT
ncbi:MAG: DNA mismatch repair protein MutS, partial [Clostridia bacterium]|nr:DNA mismatch repair protein MutS [Clostridia bacterium]